MKNLKRVILTSIISCIFILLLSILDFAALHDIKNDYISRHILEYLEISLQDKLPNWTTTAGEWRVVSISLFFRLVFVLFNIAALFYIYKKSYFIYRKSL